MAELKPCPFCGCRGDDLALLPADADWFVYCINCNTCGATGETKKEAIEAWNRRYTPTSEIDFDYEAED